MFQLLDTTTQGNWKGHYGNDGYLIANDSNHQPSYAIAGTAAAQYTWADPSTDPRALLKGASSTDRIASTYYATSSFTFDVNLTDGQTHEVALYLLDLDTTTRAETISVLDTASNAVLDSRPLTNFHNGLYAVWNVQGHVTIQVSNAGGLNAVVSGVFFRTQTVSDPNSPTIAITSPAAGNVSATVAITATANAVSPAVITSVQFQVDGVNLAGSVTAVGSSYSISWDTTKATNTTHTLTASATDSQNRLTTSSTVTVTVSNAGGTPAPSATFVKTDATTGGNWRGSYGFEGGVIAADASFPPAYGAPATDAPAYVWWASSTDPRALLKGSSTTDRIASAYYSSSSFSFDLNLMDGQAHQVAIYCLDLDTTTRNQKISILDAATHSVLNSQSITNFHNGIYVVWNLQGHVTIQVSNMGGLNAVVSGIFFGASAPATPPPTVGITTPVAGSVSGTATVSAVANASSPAIMSSVQFQVDGSSLAPPVTGVGPSYSISWDTTTASNGSHTLTAIATDSFGQHTISSGVTVSVSNPTPPTVSIASPAQGNTVQNSVTVMATAASTWPGVTISSVQILLDGSALPGAVTAAGSSYSIPWNTATATNGQHALTAIATDSLGHHTTSNPVTVTVANGGVPTSASVTFVKSDNTTLGYWKGVYGLDGAIIANDANSPPAYAVVNIAGSSSYTWSGSTTDARALLKYASATDRIASTYYTDTALTIDLNLIDGQLHQVALYCVDLDTNTRSETISILNAGDHSVLDSQSMSNFSNGRYLVWNLQGHVLIQVTNVGSPNAVVSGLFFRSFTGLGLPSVSISSPLPAAVVSGPISVGANATSPQGIASVQFLVDGASLAPGATAGPLYTVPWATPTVSDGPHNLTAIAVDTLGLTAKSAAVPVTVLNGPLPAPSALFVGSDTSTSGSWVGTYGQDGFIIANDITKPPFYAAVNFNGATTWTWYAADPTTDPPGLVKSPTNPERIGAAFQEPYSGSYPNNPPLNVDVNFVDNLTHQLALYFVDWHHPIRTQLIQVLNPNSQAVLDSQTISAFDGGNYLIWNIRGHVRFQITVTGWPGWPSSSGAPNSVVVSGLFFNH